MGRSVLALALLAVPALAQPSEITSVSPCVGCQTTAEQVRGDLSDRDWQTVAGGAIVTGDVHSHGANGSEQHAVRAIGLVREPPAKVWEVLIDFPGRLKWQHDFTEIRVVRADGERIWVAEKLKVLFVTIGFQIINTLHPDTGAISFEMDESAPHDIAASKGFWQLAPSGDDQQQTLVAYHAWVDAGRYVPDFVQSFLLERSLPHVIDGLREEVQRRFGAS